MYPLHRFLVDYDMAMLRALARNRGVTLTTNVQAEAVDHLATALLEPLSVRTAVARLSEVGRQALGQLQSAGGRMRARHFARHFGQARPIGPGRLERETPWEEPANPAEELWYAGLIFRAFAEDETGPGEFVFVPDDLLPLLPQLHEGPAGFVLEVVSAPERDAGPDTPGQQGGLVQDLFRYLVFLQTREIRPHADGRLGKRDFAELRKALSRADERRLHFMRHLAERLGFVTRRGEHLRLEAPAVKRWLNGSLDQQIGALQGAWRDDPTWHDLCQVPDLVCDEDTGWLLRYDAVAARQALLALIARCPVEAWWSLESFVAVVKKTDPDFQRPDGDYRAWYIRDATTKSYLSGFETWDSVEGALIRDLLTGPLHWLEVVDVVGRGSEAVCYLTSAGARFLGLVQDTPDAKVFAPIVVRPDSRIEVPTPVNLYVRFQLERFAELESERPCRYLLTAPALTRALARGVRVEQILAFLEQSSNAPVPANVAGQLRLWAGRFGQVELEEVALLQVKNERVLRELTALPETRNLIDRVLSPTLAVVQKGNLARLWRELRTLGYYPPPDSGRGGENFDHG